MKIIKGLLKYLKVEVLSELMNKVQQLKCREMKLYPFNCWTAQRWEDKWEVPVPAEVPVQAQFRNAFLHGHLHTHLWSPALAAHSYRRCRCWEIVPLLQQWGPLPPLSFSTCLFLAALYFSFISSCLSLSFSPLLSQYTLMIHQGILSFNDILWCGGLKSYMSFPYAF